MCETEAVGGRRSSASRPTPSSAHGLEMVQEQNDIVSRGATSPSGARHIRFKRGAERDECVCVSVCV